MKVLSVAVVLGAFTSFAGQGTQRDAELPAIEQFHQQEIAATLSRDPVALTDLWTDDAVRFGQGRAAEAGKHAIRESNARWAARAGVKVLAYVPETKDVTIGDGLAIEWGYVTGSYVDAPGGEPKQIRGARLMVLKKLPDGSWKCFRGMGGPAWTLPEAGQAVQASSVAIGKGERKGSATDLAAFEKLYQKDIVATLARDAVALTEPWADDAVRIGPAPPAEVGKEAIRQNNERWAAVAGIKVLTYVPEIKNLTVMDGWAVEWRTFTGSFIASPAVEPTQIRSTLLAVYKKLPDGSWKVFRSLGTME